MNQHPLPRTGDQVRARRARTTVVSIILALALLAAVVLSAASGQLALGPAELLHVIGKPFGLDWGAAPALPTAETGFWTVRLPRIVMALLVGAALAVAGLLMQAVFGNPLAEPGVVGVSSGAAVGACAAIVFGLTTFGEWTVPAFAFGAALLTMVLVYLFSRSQGRTEVITLILTGVAINAFAGAALAFLSFSASSSGREQILFWQLGSMNGARWVQVLVVLPVLVLGILVAATTTRKLDLLSLGEKNARHLGVNVERLRLLVIVLIALLTAAAVSFVGIVSFVGLVVPHLLRMILGPAHRPLLLTSILGGAVLMTLVDLYARTGVAMAELPLGMLTALIGGPFFFFLLWRTRRSAGGWA